MYPAQSKRNLKTNNKMQALKYSQALFKSINILQAQIWKEPILVEGLELALTIKHSSLAL